MSAKSAKEDTGQLFQITKTAANVISWDADGAELSLVCVEMCRDLLATYKTDDGTSHPHLPLALYSS